MTIPSEWVDALTAVVSQAVAEEFEKRGAALREGFLDVDRAAEFLASTPTAVRSLVKRDAIPYHKAPNRRLLFDRDELDTWVRSG